LIPTSNNVGEGLARLARYLRLGAVTSTSSCCGGVSYQLLLDMARRDAAERYLTSPPLSIGEVAYLLGYSEAAAFKGRSGGGSTKHRSRSASVNEPVVFRCV